MTTPNQLSALAARVEAGSGRDKQLDYDVAMALDYLGTHAAEPPLTSSLDAMIALIEERLPGIGGNCHGYDSERGVVDAYVSRNNVQSGHWYHSGTANSAARALLGALLKALAQQSRPTEQEPE